MREGTKPALLRKERDTKRDWYLIVLERKQKTGSEEEKKRGVIETEMQKNTFKTCLISKNRKEQAE